MLKSFKGPQALSSSTWSKQADHFSPPSLATPASYTANSQHILTIYLVCSNLLCIVSCRFQAQRLHIQHCVKAWSFGDLTHHAAAAKGWDTARSRAPLWAREAQWQPQVTIPNPHLSWQSRVSPWPCSWRGPMLWAHQGPLAVLLATFQNERPEQGTVTGTLWHRVWDTVESP